MTKRQSSAPYIFLSYAHQDIEVAKRIHDHLTAAGFRVFWDQLRINSSHNWDMKIERALRRTQRMVLVLSQTSMPYRKEVHREWFYYDQQNKPIHPILIEKCEIHSRIYAYQYLDARYKLEDSLEKLVTDLKSEFQEISPIGTAERILVTERADKERSYIDTLRELSEAVQFDRGSVALTMEQVNDIASRSPRNNREYRLGRIAQWSGDKYKIDKRFVRLKLLLDRGEDSGTNQRWVVPKNVPGLHDLRRVLTLLPHPAIVLLGQPGSGKSTLLRRLQLDVAIEGVRKPNPNLSFFVPLSQYPLDQEPYEWLQSEWKKRYSHMPPLTELVEQGRMLFLLDAFNEIPYQTDNFQYCIDQWRSFLQQTIHKHAGNRVIFSCRSLDYSAPLSSAELMVPQVRIERMTDEQIMQFLQAYNPAHAAMLWERLRNSPQFDLFRTPYLLMLMVQQDDIPVGKAPLFAGFIRQALQRELRAKNPLFDPEKGLLSEADVTQVCEDKWTSAYQLPDDSYLIQKLRHLAYEMQANYIQNTASQVRISYQRACEILNTEAQKAHDILLAGVDLNVLEIDMAQTEVTFLHQLLQEFFAARQLVLYPKPELVHTEWEASKIQPPLRDLLKGLATSDPLPPSRTTGWEETTLLAATMDANPGKFVRQLTTVNLNLAGRCLTEPDVKVPKATLKQIQAQLQARMQDPLADLRHRLEAGFVLGWLGYPDLIDEGKYISPPLLHIDDESRSFQIGKYPVTNAEFKRFLDAKGYDTKRWWRSKPAKAWQRGEMTAEAAKKGMRKQIRLYRNLPESRIRDMVKRGVLESDQAETFFRLRNIPDDELERMLDDWYPSGRQVKPRFWDDEQFKNPAQPVVGVTYYEAAAYCEWLSEQMSQMVKLPTQAQWQHAMGERNVKLICNTFEQHIRRTSPVGMFVEDISDKGILDRFGNVFEWTRSAGGDAESRVVCGGSYMHRTSFPTSKDRLAGARDAYLGFRVVVMD